MTEIETETSNVSTAATTRPTAETKVQETVPKKRSRAKRRAPKTFKDAYKVLKNNATLLQQQDEPDIDNLMKTVEDSITAYKVCQDRINAVQLALDEAFAIETVDNEDIDSNTFTD